MPSESSMKKAREILRVVHRNFGGDIAWVNFEIIMPDVAMKIEELDEAPQTCTLCGKKLSDAVEAIAKPCEAHGEILGIDQDGNPFEIPALNEHLLEQDEKTFVSPEEITAEAIARYGVPVGDKGSLQEFWQFKKEAFINGALWAQNKQLKWPSYDQVEDAAFKYADNDISDVKNLRSFNGFHEGVKWLKEKMGG